MFTDYQQMQYASYNEAAKYFAAYPNRLINVEKFVMDEILHFINLHLPEIVNDYNEASYLFPFWKNYAPLERGNKPRGDQYPWLEVGEQVFGNKLSRYFAANFYVKDSGLPSGSDDRCIISNARIKQLLCISDSVWVFIDIKSAGPRDDYENAVMSPYQISGSGKWIVEKNGISNDPIIAKGRRTKHDFMCSLSPIYVLSDKTIAPLLSFVIKPIYDMVLKNGNNVGQPLKMIKIISIPNGILLTKSPNYLKKHPNLFYPGKDDRNKDLRKIRARVSFDTLKKIDSWRVKEINVMI